jgi:hypothetical protein
MCECVKCTYCIERVLRENFGSRLGEVSCVYVYACVCVYEIHLSCHVYKSVAKLLTHTHASAYILYKSFDSYTSRAS